MTARCEPRGHFSRWRGIFCPDLSRSATTVAVKRQLIPWEGRAGREDRGAVFRSVGEGGEPRVSVGYGIAGRAGANRGLAGVSRATVGPLYSAYPGVGGESGAPYHLQV